PFAGFGWPAARDGSVALWGDSQGQSHEGLYFSDGKTPLTRIAANGIPAPGRAGDSFAYFGSTYSLDDFPSDIAFTAQTKLNLPGVYARIRGTFVKVIAMGDLLPPNKSVTYMSPVWASGTTFAHDDAWEGQKQIAFVANTS